jgi:DNA-binding CsgD family transcriptional regulator
MPVASPERLRADLRRLLHRGAGIRDFVVGAGTILARAVPFDGLCVLTMDPATRLPTGEVVRNGLPAAATARMTEIEFRGRDLNTFDALARSGRPAASLSAATDGHLDRSVRHREVRRPHGFGDELRAGLVSDTAMWGGLTLLRAHDRVHFTPAEATLVAAVAPELAEGLRRAVLLTALAEARHDRPEASGLALLSPANEIIRISPPAERWFAELREGRPGHAVPPVVAAVASRARGIVDGSAPTGALARARVRTASGVWLVVHGSTLGDEGDALTAVIIEPARPHELAPLVADAYGLTERERAVTQLVARGLPTSAIAGRLHLSPWTVQDHLKSIFGKVGVGTRGELVARMFFEHYAPRLTDGSPLGCDGWFAP